MTNTREPNLIRSSLSRTVRKNGIAVEVHICRLETDKSWTLEVVNSKGTSIVWDGTFETDEDAYAEFDRKVEEEGMETFLDSGNVIPFRR